MLTFCLMSLTVSDTALVRMLVSAQGWELSLAFFSPRRVLKVVTLVLKAVTGPSMAWLVSAMNCSHTSFSRLSTSFLESSRCS